VDPNFSSCKIPIATLFAAVTLRNRCDLATPPAPSADAEIAALKKEIAELKKSAYHPELSEQV
jgi:hypothetical protein